MSTSSQYQHDIHFTLEEARNLLPWLRERLEKIRSLFHSLDLSGFDVLKGRWKTGGNGHGNSPPPKEFDDFKRLIGELDEKGVLIKDFEQGIVDIPYIRPNGVEVYLCWMLDEETIAYWHRIPEGFMGRTPIEIAPPENADA